MSNRSEDSQPAGKGCDPSSYYDEAYFAYQQRIGEFSGWAELPKFARYISPGDIVVDFGCGGGDILKNLDCAERIGVEVNDAARAFAQTMNGIRTVKSVEELGDAGADVIISNHALEHCSSPFGEISGLLAKLKPGGLFVCYVPHECITNRWKPGSVDNHLYTWNAMTLGNLFSSAGYAVVNVGPYYHIWPPFYAAIAKCGRRAFDLSSFIWGWLRGRHSQVRIVARKPAIGLCEQSSRVPAEKRQ